MTEAEDQGAQGEKDAIKGAACAGHGHFGEIPTDALEPPLMNVLNNLVIEENEN